MSKEENVSEASSAEKKQNDKEFNFRQLESKYERIIEQERLEREKLAQEIEHLKQQKANVQEDDDDVDPYVDHRNLEKKLKRFEKELDEKFDKRTEEKATKLLEKREQENWLNGTPDFVQTLQNHAERFFEKAPKLAEAILKMPDTFERKKLVYHNIKSLGLDQPETAQPSIQEKIDSNRRSPYYQPSGVATAPYAQAGDFSETGKKRAWEEVQKLKQGLRLGF
jgi:hypothetical protein